MRYLIRVSKQPNFMLWRACGHFYPGLMLGKIFLIALIEVEISVSYHYVIITEKLKMSLLLK